MSVVLLTKNVLHLALRTLSPFAMAALLLACGGPSAPNDVARVPRLLPSVASVASFRSNESCSEGPFEIVMRARGSSFGENFSIFVVGANAGGSFIVSAGPRERALVKARGRFQQSGAAEGTRVCSGASSATSLVPAPTTEGGAGDLVVSFGGPIHPLIREPFPPFPAGEEIRISFRFDRAVPLSAIRFNLVQSVFHPNIPQNEWMRGFDERKETALVANNNVLYDLKCGVHCSVRQEERAYLEFGKPPPRTDLRTPRPSKNATWLPGFWTRDPARTERLGRTKTAILPDEYFVWFPGFWFVPTADLLDRQTMVSPVAPPDPLAETPPPPPMEGAVWIEGGWAFSGAEWLWSPGYWRHPKMRPATKARWVNDGLWVRYFPETY